MDVLTPHRHRLEKETPEQVAEFMSRHGLSFTPVRCAVVVLLFDRRNVFCNFYVAVTFKRRPLQTQQWKGPQSCCLCVWGA